MDVHWLFQPVDLGLGRALTQIIAQRLGMKDVKEFSGLVWTALVIMAVMGVVSVVIATSLSPFLISNLFKMSGQLRPEINQNVICEYDN